MSVVSMRLEQRDWPGVDVCDEVVAASFSGLIENSNSKINWKSRRGLHWEIEMETLPSKTTEAPGNS